MSSLVFAFPFPWPGCHGIVLPTLAAAYEKHDQPEDKHDHSPAQIEVDSHRSLIQRSVSAGDESVYAHDAARDQENQAERDADVESHKAPSNAFCYAKTRLRTTSMASTAIASVAGFWNHARCVSTGFGVSE